MINAPQRQLFGYPLPTAGKDELPTSHRAYVVTYQLKLAELRYGTITSSFFAPCARRFDTDELNVILAELYAEVGPSPYLLGIEILTIRSLAAAMAA